MKKLSPEVHGILDYVTILLLLISPTLFRMHTVGSNFTYALAFVHLMLTLLTDFRAGVFKVIPLRIHGLIEITVAIGLVGIAILFKVSGDTVEFYFYLIFSVILFIVWAISEYGMHVKAAT